MYKTARSVVATLGIIGGGVFAANYSLRYAAKADVGMNSSKRPPPKHTNQVPQSVLDPNRPPIEWDRNWDKRDPEFLVQEQGEERAALVKAKTPTAERILVLVRHGQYVRGDKDEDKVLTPLGREQAELTGKRLKNLIEHLKEGENEVSVQLTMSTMARAKETANIILKHLSPEVAESAKSCDLIREGAPCEPIPRAKDWKPAPAEFYAEGARIEAAFRNYVHRADPEQKNNSIEILVCHGNVIRYFACRALQLPPEAWLRISLQNGSLTILSIRPSSNVSLSALGESGHLPTSSLTYN